MHICIVSSEYPPHCGGIGVYTEELSKRLELKKHEVTILTRGSALKPSYFKDGTISIYRIFCPPLYPFHVKFHKPFLERFLKKYEQNIDIIHFQYPAVPLINTKIKTIATIHGAASGGISAMQITDINSIFTKAFSNQFLKLERDIVLGSDVILPISKHCERELNESYNIKTKQSYVVGNGIDTSLFKSKDLNRTNDEVDASLRPFRLIYVGRISSQKGLMDLVKAVAFLKKSNFNIECTLIGTGPFMSPLKRNIKSLGLQSCFLFKGYVRSKDLLNKYYNESDAFVLPSYYEGMPTSLMEAMACGLPCIATCVGGIPELIQNNINGFLISPGNYMELANAICKIYNDREFSSKLGRNAEEFIRRNYDWNLITKKILNIYKHGYL